MTLDYLMDCPPYDERSAGIRAMHYLAALLHRAGITCWTAHPNPFVNLPVTHLRTTENLVVIYPDCAGPENLRASSCCVRFMCAPASWPRPWFFGGDKIPAGDMVFVYDGWYLGDIAAHYGGDLWPDCVLPIPCIEPGLYYPEQKTIGKTTYTGKTTPSGGVVANRIITRENHSRQSAAAILRKTKHFHTLDNYTMMAREAVLCGCEVTKEISDGIAGDYFEGQDHDAEYFIMRPETDTALARKFDGMVRRHFGVGQTPHYQEREAALNSSHD